MGRSLLVAVLLVGCGVGHDDDPTGTGSGSDMTMPPPGTTPNVSMTVRFGADPAPNVPVIFLTNEGANMGAVMTDANGVAAGSLPLGGSVSLVFPGSPSTVYTYAGVKPNDKLSFVGPSVATTPTTVTIMVPAAPSGGQVSITTPCSGTIQGDAPAITLDLVGCGTETDFYVSDGVTAGFLKRVPVAPTIDLSAETYHDAVTTTLSITGLPEDNLDDSIGKRLETDLLRPAFSVDATAAIDTSDATADVSVPDVPGIMQLVVAVVEVNSVTSVAARAAYTADPTTIDVSDALLPAVTDAQLASGSVMWTEDGMGSTADTSIVTLHTPAVTHLIAAAHHDSSVAVLDLPAPYQQYNLASMDIPTIDVELLKATGGYDAIRANIFNGDPTELAPMDGTISVMVAPAPDPNAN